MIGYDVVLVIKSGGVLYGSKRNRSEEYHDEI